MRWILIVAAVLAAGCGGGGVGVETPGPAPVSVDWGRGPALITQIGTVVDVPIRVLNYSNAAILDMGIRPLGSGGAWLGRLSGHDPVTFGSAAGGGSDWVVVPHGGYEIWVLTSAGEFFVSGWTRLVEVAGVLYPAPSDVYVWGWDVGG